LLLRIRRKKPKYVECVDFDLSEIAGYLHSDYQFRELNFYNSEQKFTGGIFQEISTERPRWGFALISIGVDSIARGGF
jgi:hypothetical protein